MLPLNCSAPVPTFPGILVAFEIVPFRFDTLSNAIELLKACAEAGVKPHTRVYALEQANQALADMKAGRIDGTGVLMVKG